MNPSFNNTTEDLVCVACNIWSFESSDSFYFHHLAHISLPAVTLVKLSDRVFEDLQHKSYRLNYGVARRTVSPLKISVKKQLGGTIFAVVKSSNSKEVGGEVEGDNGLLERFGANISVVRRGNGSPKVKGKTADPASPQPTTMATENSSNGKSENILEKLSGIGGISLRKKSADDETEDVKPSGLSIATKSNAKAFDINAYRGKLKEKLAAEEKSSKTPDQLLAQLSGISGISFAPKGGGQIKTEEELKKIDEEEKPKEDTSVEEDEDATDSGSEEEEEETPQVDTKPEQKVRVSTQLFAVKEEQHDVKVKPMSELVGKVEIGEESKPNIDNRNLTPKEEESGINILQRLAVNLNEAKVAKSEPIAPSVTPPVPVSVAPAPVTADDDDDDIIMEEEIPNSKRCLPPPKPAPISPTPSEQLHPDFIAPQQDIPPVIAGQVFQTEALTTDVNQQAMLQQQALTGYTDVSCLETYTSQQTLVDDQQMVNNTHLLQVADKGPVQQQTNVDFGVIADASGNPLNTNTYWTDVGTPQQDQPQQDPLMTAEGQPGEAMTQTFLQNFLTDQQQQAVQHAIPADGAEFVSLDRLGQGLDPAQQQQNIQQQQQPGGFATGIPEGNSPVDQMAQQVQRLPNAPPQITVVPQHQMQAVPQQMHGGVTLSPQHMAQPQTAQQFDQQQMMQPGMQNSMQPPGMQPPGMPQLYPSYNVFTQNYGQPQQQQQQQQGQPRFQVPQAGPPMLQARPGRPQIQARSFQSMAPIPRQRPRFAVKRTMVRLPNPQELTPPKQRRTEGMVQVRSPASPANRINVTPPKKTQEANKVANVLASRGITVTPTANRQQQNRPTNPALANLSSQISVTPSSANRNSGFAVPKNRSPIVNHNLNRPDRCTTVDLTQDDEPQRQRITLGRFPCNMCTKVFTSTAALEAHKSNHRTGALAYKCDKCSAQYPSLQDLNHHSLTFHKKKVAPDLAIPVIDINQLGAKDRLKRCGFTDFIPLSQLQSNSNGVYGIPIINLDTAKEKVVSNLNSLGASNIFVLGKLKPLSNT